ncbi:hypothetical protein I4F81_001806 [Pyropia yezoensis]|uniref:Uncharacterized protein n=1 Tax=Pyropia yezoensis TaxID=2788 RepID=A0ACC3BN90_PYRYE|nr:hypothetical protein I4F81_001806 [Neopyropia yezoensis]
MRGGGGGDGDGSHFCRSPTPPLGPPSAHVSGARVWWLRVSLLPVGTVWWEGRGGTAAPRRTRGCQGRVAPAGTRLRPRHRRTRVGASLVAVAAATLQQVVSLSAGGTGAERAALPRRSRLAALLPAGMWRPAAALADAGDGGELGGAAAVAAATFVGSDGGRRRGCRCRRRRRCCYRCCRPSRQPF